MPADHEKNRPAESKALGRRARRADLKDAPADPRKGPKTGSSTGGDAPEQKKGEAPPAPDAAAAPGEDERPADAFPIVGIGASAGGLEALESFFKALPADSGMACVVVTHTVPDKTSLLPDILRRQTTVAVTLIEDGLQAAPDTVYLPPSDRDVVLEGETLRLRKRPIRDELHMPVDLFLKSLAAARGARAAGVVLSGTGTDGTYGLRSVKERAGLTVAQDPEQARHAGMPTSAIETGLVDIVAPAGRIPGRLIDYFRRPAPDLTVEEGPPRDRGERIDPILSFLARRTRHDFSLYKTSTLERRIARRMTVTQSPRVADYLQRLEEDSAESRALFQDLLIGVTNFFRDPEAFAFLKKKILPRIVKRAESRLRVWVPGCATGEEVYSISILIQEYLAENDSVRELQIFGTDIDARAIAKARLGRYPRNIAVDVGRERLERCFIQEEDHYRIKRDLREPVIFAEQNVLRDPPFSDLDLLVCRNLLIYLQAEAQDRVIPLFHHVLRPEGILFLGNSESIGRFSQLFKPLSKTYSIFRKREQPLGTAVHFPTGKIDPAKLRSPNDAAEEESPGHETPSLDKAVEHILLEDFAPACAVVSPRGDVVFTRGRTGDYLELAQGRPNLNITDMAREGLRFPLIAGLRQARESEGWVGEKGLRIKTNGEHQWIDLQVRCFKRPPLKDHLVVVMSPGADPAARAPGKADGESVPGGDPGTGRIQALEQELLRLRHEYRSAREELETANEELRSSNEELQSSNEELQSTNEELESSREELHSLNEELNTVNDELNHKIDELQGAFKAVSDTLNSTRIAMVFLDRELKVVRFTQEATDLINLIDSDTGRPLRHIADNLEDIELARTAAQVLDTLEPHESEVRTQDGRWYRMNILIHRMDRHRIEGVVITFVNVDAQKAAQEKVAAQSRRFADSIVATVREALLVLSEDMRVLSANPSFYRMFRSDPASTEGRLLFELGHRQWDIPGLRRLLETVAAEYEAFEDFPVTHDFPGIGRKVMRLNARHLREEDAGENRILLAIEDITGKAER